MAKPASCSGSHASRALCIFAFASFLATTQCSVAFNAAKLKDALTLFKFRQTGSFGSVEKSFLGCEVWKTVPDTHSEKVKPMCDWLHKKGLQPVNVSAAYHALSAYVNRNCEYDPELSQTVEDMLLAGGAAADLIPLHHAALGLSILKEKGWAKDPDALSAAFEKAWATLESLSTTDGKFKYSSEGEGEGSFLAAGIAVEAGAALLRLGLKSSGDEVALLKRTVSKIWGAAIATEDGVAVPVFPGDKGGHVAATSAAVKGTIALYSVLDEPLKVAPKLEGAATYLLSIGSPSSPPEAFHQISALSLLNDNKVYVPLVVRLPTLIYTGASFDLSVFISTVLGSVPPVGGVKLLSVTGAKGKSLVGEAAMKALGKQEQGPVGAKFVVDLEALGVKDLGEYTASFEVSVEPLYAISAHLQTTFLLSGSVTVTDVLLSVVDGDGTVDHSAPSGEETGESEGNGEGKVKPKLKASHLQTLKVECKVGTNNGPFVPEQVILKLVHGWGGREYSSVTKPSEGAYTFELPFLKLMDQLFYTSGVYKIKLIVGDRRMDDAFSWDLGSVDLLLPTAPETAPKPPALNPLSTRFAPASEISHIFRVPEKRPPSLVSYAFSALALLPLAGFLVGLGFLGINLDAFPSGGLPLVSAVAFHGGIASVLLLYFQFWLNMNLFFTLKTLVVLGLITMLPGHHILAYLANSTPKLKVS